MNDLEIRAFKNGLVAYMNKYPIALEVKRLVLSEVLHETTTMVDEDIRTAIKQLKEKEDAAEANPEKSPE